MFTVKLYQFAGGESDRQIVTVLPADSVQVVRLEDHTVLTIFEGEDAAAYRLQIDDYAMFADEHTLYHRAIIENANGRTTEIVNP